MSVLSKVDAFIFLTGGGDLKDTVDLMLSDDPLDRMNAEAIQLAIRIRKAEAYLQKMYGAAWTLDALLQQDLLNQVKAMRSYLKILLHRIENFKYGDK